MVDVSSTFNWFSKCDLSHTWVMASFWQTLLALRSLFETCCSVTFDRHIQPMIASNLSASISSNMYSFGVKHYTV